MPRVFCGLVGLALLAPVVRADLFDDYTNPLLAQVPHAAQAKKLSQATAGLLAEHGGLVSGTAAAFLVVRTQDGHWSKLLVQGAQQKVPGGNPVPIFLIERFATFKEGEERALLAQGQNVRLFAGFFFSLDLGQVVPEALGGDLRCRLAEGGLVLEPVGKAELYLLQQGLPVARPAPADKFVPGAPFVPRFFTGKYKLYDDGRRSGTLWLQVSANGEVTGHYYSDKDGRKYEVTGKVGTPNHRIHFRIVFPRTMQDFYGWLFTGDGRVLTGYTRWQEHETGFYALRQE